ncbi:hypothetical protein SHI21_16225 [Bacteriovorax sp. PP10]|uniref:Uncharacterized protein n=1 Tax=Bacteriovorax antarcticus TaxID=3088717 RepID=A0ABU5VZN9_9BACT|nr:hypothetical protein [Bacteriovorax sp. PP10]MEA9357779.1 hypothetical protein [Bacteriovorax sp. PP10]
MKVRGLSALVTVLVLALLVLVGSRYLKSQKNIASDDMKSQLTPNEQKKKGLKEIIAGNLQKQEEMVERKDFDDASLLVRERVYTEAEINNMSEVEFRALLVETEAKLPTVGDIRKLPAGALHRTPAPVMQAGKDLGLLKEVLKVHESYERDAVNFYKKCALTKERPMSVKALCLTNLIEIKKKNGEKLNLAAFPSDVVELTRLITDM